jgi:hypothetical protein
LFKKYLRDSTSALISFQYQYGENSGNTLAAACMARHGYKLHASMTGLRESAMIEAIIAKPAAACSGARTQPS